MLVAYSLIYLPMSLLIGQLLAHWTPQMPPSAKADNDSLLRGQTDWLSGENADPDLRAAGANSGDRFLLAAKSIFRFGDLRQSDDKMRTEYVLLGTLFSFTLTIMLGLLVNKLLW